MRRRTVRDQKGEGEQSGLGEGKGEYGAGDEDCGDGELWALVTVGTWRSS